jgi:hypothetical protein
MVQKNNITLFQFHKRRLITVAMELEDHIFRHFFRMKKTTFQSLLEEVSPDIPIGKDNQH